MIVLVKLLCGVQTLTCNVITDIIALVMTVNLYTVCLIFIVLLILVPYFSYWFLYFLYWYPFFLFWFPFSYWYPFFLYWFPYFSYWYPFFSNWFPYFSY